MRYQKIGASFRLISQLDYTYINPNSDPRPTFMPYFETLLSIT